MRNILLIAKREYLEQVRSRSFRFSTALVPLLVAMLMVGDHLTLRHAQSGEHIAIAASDPQLANAIKSELLTDKKAGFTVDVAPRIGKVVAILSVKEDTDLMIITRDGKIIRLESGESGKPAAPRKACAWYAWKMAIR